MTTQKAEPFQSSKLNTPMSFDPQVFAAVGPLSKAHVYQFATLPNFIKLAIRLRKLCRHIRT